MPEPRPFKVSLFIWAARLEGAMGLVQRGMPEKTAGGHLPGTAAVVGIDNKAPGTALPDVRCIMGTMTVLRPLPKATATRWAILSGPNAGPTGQ